MFPVSAINILNIWESGQYQYPLDLALTLLSAANPEISREDLAALDIEQRDTLLFRLREQVCGHNLNGYAECPQCGERLEFCMTTAEILNNKGANPLKERQSFEFISDNITIHFRLPNSKDIAESAAVGNDISVKDLLFKRCVIASYQDGEQIDAKNLTAEILSSLEEKVSEYASVSDLLINLCCSECKHHWHTLFDIVSFFWAEIGAMARSLMYEVHLLAKTYGWSESEILALSPARRNFYLGMVNS